MSKKLSAMILMTMLAASGCVSTSAVMMNSSQTYRPTDNVAILFEAPERDYDIIAIVEGNGSVFNNYSQVLKKIQEKAKKIGAHAIIPITTESQYVPTKYITNVDGSLLALPDGNKITIKTAAIRYK